MTRLTRRASTDEGNVQAMGWLGRLIRLDFTVFEEIRTDRSATPTALGIVFVAGFLGGVGTVIWAMQHGNFDNFDTTNVILKSLILGSLIQAAVWFTWVYVTWMFAARIYGSPVLFSELVRTMGFAFAPIAFTVFIGFPALAIPVGILFFGATLLLTAAAVEYSADLDRRQAIIATLVGFAIFLTFMGAFANVLEEDVFGGLAPGILFFTLDL